MLKQIKVNLLLPPSTPTRRDLRAMTRDMVAHPHMTTRNMSHMSKHPTTHDTPIKATFNDSSSQTLKQRKITTLSCCYYRTIEGEREGIGSGKREVLGYNKLD